MCVVLFYFILSFCSVMSHCWCSTTILKVYSFTLQAIFNEKIFLGKCHPKDYQTFERFNSGGYSHTLQS